VLGRRLVILVAVLMGLTALAASVAPPPAEQRRQGRQTPTPSPTPSTSTSTAGDPNELSLTLEVGAKSHELHAVVGDSIRLEVTAGVADSVVIDGLDAVEAVAPDSPAEFELFADRPGTYPISLLDSGREVGELVISSNR
jgi:hypothetical protein